MPAASETGVHSCHKTRLCSLREPGLTLPLWDHLTLHADPRVQLLEVFENSVGNGGIPHPVRANSETKEILRCVICFSFSGVFGAFVAYCGGFCLVGFF